VDRLRVLDLGAPAADEQQHLVARVGDRVDAFGKHRCGTGQHRRDQFGQRDPEVGQQRGDDRARTTAMTTFTVTSRTMTTFTGAHARPRNASGGHEAPRALRLMIRSLRSLIAA
jgi:hypothetical protein